MDRILYTSTHYPANYGFYHEHAEDSDPLDVLVLCSEDLEPMSMVRCYPVGVVRMIDQKKLMIKSSLFLIMNLPWNFYQNIEDLPPHISEEIEHFFGVYKNLEHKETTNIEVLGRKMPLE